MPKDDKTNVMRLLDSFRTPYTPYFYDPQETDGQKVAALLGEDPDTVFKTLVTKGAGDAHYVFVIPVNCTLSLKKAAKAASEKSIAMIPQKELLPLTGYVHGGCSPFGMKKQFPVFLNDTAELFDVIRCSAGRVGAQIGIRTEDFLRLTGAKVCDLTEE